MNAIISDCGFYRYRLDRDMLQNGIVFAYFGINPSTAEHEIEDQTTKKWRGFTVKNGGSRYIAGNAFAFRSSLVKDLLMAVDPVGPENDRYLREIIAEADMLVPCWGNETKAPKKLRYQFAQLKAMLIESGKPIKIFGLTNTGCPKHPQMLGYDTPLIEYRGKK